MKRIPVLTMLTALLALWTMTVFAAVPQLINFQGVLRDGSGNPVANGSYSVVFTIYVAPSGGSALWTETKSVVTTGGLFNTLLGSVTPIPDSLFNDSSRYLGIKVGADPEMAPRQQLVSLSYAFRVNSVDGASGGTITSKVSIGPGHMNTGYNAFVAGDSNTVSGNYAAIGGGLHNTAADTTTTVGGGESNAALARHSTIGGGMADTVVSGGWWCTIGGGYSNFASGFNSTVAGGTDNTASGSDASTVGGGHTNAALGAYSTVGGGYFNQASGTGAFIGGGSSNIASGLFNSFVGGGYLNQASGQDAAIGGGNINIASGLRSFLGGGSYNKARGDYSFVGGGGGATTVDSNSALGAWSTIPGGNRNRAAGNYSFAAGRRAKADHLGSFVWADSSVDADFASTAANQFLIRAANVGIGLNNPSKKLEVAGSIKGDTLFSNILSSNSPLSLQAPAGTTRIFIKDADGNVGIGTTGPNTKLTVWTPSVAGIQEGLRINNPVGFAGSGNGSSLVFSQDRDTTENYINAIIAGVQEAVNTSQNGYLAISTKFSSVIGERMRVTSTGNVGIGTTSPAALLHVNGTAGNNTGVWSNLSDRRLKRDIEPIQNALETVEQLQPVSFRWNDAEKDAQFGRVRGLIAQDVEKVIPEWIKTDPDGYKRIEPIGIDALLIEAIKELKAENEKLKNRILKLEKGKLQAQVEN